MKIGILEAGLLNKKLDGRYDPYPDMFAALLDRARQDFQYQAYSVIRGEMPASIHDCDGWLITGSRHGVYESLDWMLELQAFIRELERAAVPLVGICFGHQIIAQALGGNVVKSDRGWCIGLHSYAIDLAQGWMGDAPEQVGIYTFHQDQIIDLPPAAKVFSSSEFCPYAGLSYGDSIITMQAHPEFEEEYEFALLNLYGGDIVPEPVASEALADMQASGRKADTQILADWLASFFLNTGQLQKISKK